VSELRAHPAFAHAFRIYRNAVADWHGSDAVRQAAFTLGMNAREYADSRICANQFSWSASNTTGEFTREHFDLAYEDAVKYVCGVTPS
jgi:hypothetical protein